MTDFFGDLSEDQTLYIPFNTFSSDDPSASVTISNLADADIKVHKDGSATEITTDGATIAIDFDSITGNHLITIDTSADAAYSTGSDYLVRIEGTTIDGATINAWVGSFSIQNRYMRGTNSAATASALATVDTVVDGIQTDLNNGTDGLGAIKADTAATLVDTGTTIPGTITTAQGNITDILADTNELQADWVNGGRLDLIIDATLVDTAEIGTAGAGLTNIGTIATCTTVTNQVTTAQINAQMVDVIFTDTDAEPGQGTPGATISIADKIGYLYKAWRNRTNVTATAYQLLNDDASTVDQKATLSDDGTTAAKTEIVTGP